MSKAKFTKGPWRARFSQESVGVIVERNGFANVAVASVCNGYVNASDRDIADAHLIAAAPEMYELLNSINEAILQSENEFECAENVVGISDDIGKLLAKARGGK